MKIAHLSMILPESRFPLFGIMLYARQQRQALYGRAKTSGNPVECLIGGSGGRMNRRHTDYDWIN
jgi:hypothetical protein